MNRWRAKKAERPMFWLWIKYHWSLIRWLPWGGRLWKLANDRVDQWHERHEP